jgi:proline racemase
VRAHCANGKVKRVTFRNVPALGGQAWITGIATYVVDPHDPFPDGFTVGDI